MTDVAEQRKAKLARVHAVAPKPKTEPETVSEPEPVKNLPATPMPIQEFLRPEIDALGPSRNDVAIYLIRCATIAIVAYFLFEFGIAYVGG